MVNPWRFIPPIYAPSTIETAKRGAMPVKKTEKYLKFGSALHSGPRGRTFKSCHPDLLSVIQRFFKSSGFRLRLSRCGSNLEGMSVAINFTEKYFTTAQAAKILRVAPDTVKRYCNQEPPRIVGEKIGRDWMIPKSAIDKYLSDEGEMGRPRNRRRKTG